MLRLALHRRAAAFLLFTLLLCSPASELAAASLDGAATTARAAAPAALTPGTNATVHVDSGCLRIRQLADLQSAELTCLPEGAVVQVLEGRQAADGYQWQKIQTGAFIGWAAENYLVAASATPGASSCPAAGGAPPAAATPQPIATATGLAGDVPKQGGFGLVVWQGGTAEAIASAASNGGCTLSAVWAGAADGGLLVYIFGAPEVVNAGWLDAFAGGVAPANTAVLIVCGTPSASALTSSQLTAPTPTPTPAPLPAYDAKAAVVLDVGTGVVLNQKDAHLALPPASLTKIATAILAIESGNLDAWVKNDVDSRQMVGSSLMGLLPGDCFQLRDLLYGLLLPSGNDAALAIARYVAGSDAAFVDQMNALLVRLGLTDSHFVNPHGLDAPGHVASAYDLAMLANYAMTLPFFAQVVGTQQWTARGSREIALPNVNAFLTSYPGADGVKTGFTDAAGRTLVASATRSGRRVFVVLLNAPNRYEDATKLMDWAFQPTR